MDLRSFIVRIVAKTPRREAPKAGRCRLPKMELKEGDTYYMAGHWGKKKIHQTRGKQKENTRHATPDPRQGWPPPYPLSLGGLSVEFPGS